MKEETISKLDDLSESQTELKRLRRLEKQKSAQR